MKDNTLRSSIDAIRKQTLANCSASVKSLLDSYFIKIRKKKYENKETERNIKDVCFAIQALAYNLSSEEEISDRDLLCFYGIILEIDKIFEDAIQNNNSERQEYLNEKVRLIYRILVGNTDGYFPPSSPVHRLFGYNNLYAIVKLVCEEYDQLTARGFSGEIWSIFSNMYKNGEKKESATSEEQKLNDFIDILNGKKKLLPQYELKHVGYALVDSACTGPLIKQHSEIAAEESLSPSDNDWKEMILNRKLT